MSNMTQRQLKLQQLCLCHIKLYTYRKKKTKERCRKKRQVFVYNPDEEIWHEPYMQMLHHEFSDESVCDSKIELPWRDIALPTTGVKIRRDETSTAETDMEEAETKTIGDEKRESNGAMTLPWQDLIITKILPSVQDDPGICDSSLEIPWADLTLEKPVVIRPREEQICAPDDVEIPWNEILVPRNIVIESERKRKHPSSTRPPRARVVDKPCVEICCDTRPCYAENPKGSHWLATCM
ncbi:hypothetical protein P5V15_008019 [Pogonomyrmex californicus]